MTSISRSFPNRAAFSSATETTTSRANSSASPNWPARSSASPKNPDDFYHGALARELAAAIQKGGGLITADDLAHYEVKEREPIRGTYRGYDIISAPPPSSGGIVADRNPEYSRRLRPRRSSATDRPTSIHLHAEAFRRAFFDRADFMGDPDFAKIPVAQLIDKKYAAAWRDSIDPKHASASKDLKRPASSANWST